VIHAAAQASAGTALSAGIAGVVATVVEIVFWTRVSADTVATETGLHLALIVTIVVAVIYLSVGIHRLRAERSG
jgi:hypothetical protein